LDVSTLSNAELRRLESDRMQSADVWRAVVAEIARRERPPTIVTPVSALGPTSARIVVSGIDVPFWDLVVIQVKIAIASIPAVIILTVIGVVVFVFAGGLVAALRR
jgi:hypothetical protein